MGGNIIILMKFSWLAEPEVVKMTTSGAASCENFVKMTTFLFQCTGRQDSWISHLMAIPAVILRVPQSIISFKCSWSQFTD